MHTERTKRHRDRPNEASSSSSASASAKMQGRWRVPALAQSCLRVPPASCSQWNMLAGSRVGGSVGWVLALSEVSVVFLSFGLLLLRLLECGFGTKIVRTILCTKIGRTVLGPNNCRTILERFKESSKKTFELIPFLYLLQGRWWGPEGTNLSCRTWWAWAKISWCASVSATKEHIGVEFLDS